MDVESILRVLFVLLFAMYGAARWIPSRRAPTLRRTRGERWETLRREGPLVLVSMIVATYGTLIVALLYLFASSWITWSFIHLPYWVRVAGVILGILSNAYLYWVGVTLQNFYSYTVEIQESHKLITTGPYSQVRHPMYTGTLLLLFSFGITSDNLLFLVILVALIPGLFARIKKEEEALLESFGEDYVRYMNRTGSIFPRLRRNHAQSEQEMG